MKTYRPRLLACALLLCATALADEVRLKDGRVLYGKVRAIGDTYQITTRDGVVRVAKDQVDGEIIGETRLRARLQGIAKQYSPTPFAELQLAMQARRWGLEREMWKHLDASLAAPADGDGTALQERLESFLAELEPELLSTRWHTAPTEVRVGKLLDKHRNDRQPSRRAALLELLSREPNADQELRRQARRNVSPRRRALAVEALLKHGTTGNDRFAWRTAVLDRDNGVRRESMMIARRRSATRAAVDYLAPGLMHGSPEVRIRTAEAYANLGDPSAIKLLVAAGPNAGKALATADQAVRAHIAFLNQQAYIRDFDVEVAQASFIANPKIGVLQSGSVLDVTVHGVYAQRLRIVRAFRRSLQRLGGSDPGPRVHAWSQWHAGLPPRPGPVTGTEKDD